MSSCIALFDRSLLFSCRLDVITWISRPKEAIVPSFPPQDMARPGAPRADVQLSLDLLRLALDATRRQKDELRACLSWSISARREGQGGQGDDDLSRVEALAENLRVLLQEAREQALSLEVSHHTLVRVRNTPGTNPEKVRALIGRSRACVCLPGGRWPFVCRTT